MADEATNAFVEITEADLVEINYEKMNA